MNVVVMLVPIPIWEHSNHFEAFHSHYTTGVAIREIPFQLSFSPIIQLLLPLKRIE